MARGIFLGISTLSALQRFRVVDRYGGVQFALERPVIFATWHNRLALSLIVYRRLVQYRKPDRRLAALVSASRDGALLAAILEAFRVQPVRGSTSRRGALALRELVDFARQGFDVAITPDGPRGPRYQAQQGAVALASLTGIPLLPVSINARWKYEVSSWDRFQIPFPLSRCEIVVGKPLFVPDREEDLAVHQAELQRQLTELSELPCGIR